MPTVSLDFCQLLTKTKGALTLGQDDEPHEFPVQADEGETPGPVHGLSDAGSPAQVHAEASQASSLRPTPMQD